VPWWTFMIIIAVVAGAISIVYSLRAARDAERGGEVDRGVGGHVVKHKISANPIFWAIIVFVVLMVIVTIYYMFVYPEGAF